MNATEKIVFKGEMFEWRGPAPYYFISIPAPESAMIKERASELSYGWGVIPVIGNIGETEFTTSLIPKDDVYLLPIKNVVRLGEKIEVGQIVHVAVVLQGRQGL
jgi:hypothetical protein